MPKKFECKLEDAELETLLNEDSHQRLKESSTSLNVDESTVRKHLKVIGFIHKQDYWVPHFLKDDEIKCISPISSET